jgi:hypothetical protein
MEVNMAHIGSQLRNELSLSPEFELVHVDLAFENKICLYLQQDINTFTAELDMLNKHKGFCVELHNQSITLMNDDDANTTIKGRVRPDRFPSACPSVNSYFLTVFPFIYISHGRRFKHLPGNHHDGGAPIPVIGSGVRPRLTAKLGRLYASIHLFFILPPIHFN